MRLKNTTLLTSMLLFSVSAWVNAANCEKWVGKIGSIQGRVLRQEQNQSSWQAIVQEDSLCSGDKVRTAKWSRATIILKNHAVVTLDQNSTLNFAPLKDNHHWLINLLQGIAFFRSRQSQQIEIETPFINAVHKGTEFVVSVDSNQSQITVLDGQVEATNPQGKVLIDKGYTGSAGKNQKPHLQPLTITPQDAVQWSLYYPPLMDVTANHDFAAASQSYQQGDIDLALAKLEQVSANQQNKQYLILKATMLLNVGRLDQAEVILQQNAASVANKSDVYALQAVIAIAKNQQSAALGLANNAVTADPQSAVAKIAQSYAYQALFNIDEARKAAQMATNLNPNNALSWVRLSELQLAQGELKTALLSAQKAQSLSPGIARSQIMLGFAKLAQTDIKAAEQAFLQAIKLDSSDPLARLGLGLAKIRKGDVEAGKDDLETAVNLDPNNAVIRSYLGKVFYELRDKQYAGTEFQIAKEMDPKDPTPWFYDAILKLTTNRPVEALHDMQKAVELNDNRAVYRSSLLLDKDLAARSAAQGRIYNELGFQQRGLLEGWKSVNTDPGNYSAHRLLADNYSALPRHELARVSELLQSQLLQPINITPIQPNLAESNLFILNGLGANDVGYNEFNPLFEYNRFSLQASGLYGGNNTIGDNVALSGLYNKTSFSLGQFHYETDGFRQNNFLKKDLYNAFLQTKLTNDLSLQTEYRHEETAKGDLSLNFNQNQYSKDFKESRKIDSYRVGGHYDFSPNSSLIGSLIYQNIELNQYDFGNARIDMDGFISELQHIYQSSNINLVNGFGHINQNAKTYFEGDPTAIDSSVVKTNFYNYSKLNLTKQLRVTLGGSFDFVNIGEKYERNRVNPKFGLEWSISPRTILRAAAFRGLNVNKVSSQTIEPTQVAGFNQLFDDINGTASSRFGAGLDHRFSDNVSAGLEYSERHLDYLGNLEKVDRSEQLARAYLYLTPINQVSANLEYFYEQIDQSNRYMDRQNGFFHSIQTHRIPLTLSFFHQTGLTFKIKSSFVHQTGFFQDDSSFAYCQFGCDKFGRSNFFLVDLNLSYRLPRRHGIISFGVNNLLDERFNYQSTNTDAYESIISPSRVLFSKITLAF